MKNRIYYLSNQEMKKTLSELIVDDSLLLCEINGEEIQSEKEYFDYISEILNFPIKAKGFDGYNDWMCDLQWLNKDGYVLIINNYSSFLRKDTEAKKLIISFFEKSILPWWETEVEKYQVGGKAKPFNVYLVD